MASFTVSAAVVADVVALGKKIVTPSGRGAIRVLFDVSPEGVTLRTCFYGKSQGVSVTAHAGNDGDAPRSLWVYFDSLADLDKARGGVTITCHESGDVVAIWEDKKSPRVSTLREVPEASRPDSATLETSHEFESLNYSRRVRAELLALSKFTDKESGRFALGGVYFDPTGDLVATDGRRMAISTGAVGAFTPFDDKGQGVVVALPWLALPMFDSDEWKLSVYKDGLRFERCGLTITAKAIEGRFPRWRDVFASEIDCTRRIVFSPSDVAQLLAISANLEEAETRAVRLWLADGYAPELYGNGMAIDCESSPVWGDSIAGYVDGQFFRDLLAFSCGEDGAEVMIFAARDGQVESIDRLQATNGNRKTIVMAMGGYGDRLKNAMKPAARVLSRSFTGKDGAPNGATWLEQHQPEAVAVAC